MIRESSWWVLLGSLLIGGVMEIVGLPDALHPLRPPLLALCLMYWALEAPHRAGLGLAFSVGLLCDVAGLGYLGEHALRFTVLVFLVQNFRARLRFFPVWQQGFAVGLMLCLDLLLHVAQRWVLGVPQSGAEWAQPLIAIVLWPFLYLVFDFLRLRSRGIG